MAGRSPGRVTLVDVAQVAGVTKGTVSKVLNGRSDVAQDTRRRVLEAVHELGYRTTTSGTAPGSRTLAAVFDAFDPPYISNVLQGVLLAATAEQTNLLVRLAPDRAERRREASARAWMAEQQAAGVIGIIGLTLGEPNALLTAAKAAGVPFVIVDPVDVQDPAVVSIGATNWAGGRAAADHLLGLGHRRIAWVGGPATSTASNERFHGYAAALHSAGLELDQSLVSGGWFSVETGLEKGRGLLLSPQPPTGIVCGNDEIAVGVLAAARELGVPVPGRLSVVGFDDTPQARWTTPALTSVHQPLTGMGRMAVDTVLAIADGRQPASGQVQLVTSLTVRESTAPPGSS